MTIYTNQDATKDTRIYVNAPNTNYGTEEKFRLLDRANILQRALIEFDISDLPNDAIISAATFSAYYAFRSASPYADPVGLTVWAYKLNPDQTGEVWVETEATWNIYSSAGGNWDVAGGDYDTSSPAGGSTTFPAGYDWMDWNVKAIVEDAIANESDIVKIMLKYASETEDLMHYPLFRSRTYTTDITQQPKLVIVYTLPGWTGKLSGVTNPAKINGVSVANIAKVNGVASS